MIDEPVWAIVPTKCFVRGKSRLASVLDSDARAKFARGLLEHVLKVLDESQVIARVLVATDCDEVAEVARAHHAEVERDDAPSSLAAVVDHALAHAAALGARAALVLMADLPQLTAEDVRALVSALDSADIVLAPDHARRHTNALALRPPTAIATRFGSPTSLADHQACAIAAGLTVKVLDIPRVALDVDGPADLERLTRAE